MTNLPPGYRWATEDDADRDAIVVKRTVDSTGRPYTQDEADLAVPETHTPDRCCICGNAEHPDTTMKGGHLFFSNAELIAENEALIAAETRAEARIEAEYRGDR